MKNPTQKSTYDLVVQSEDCGGSLIEAAIYALFILSAAFGMCQFAAQTLNHETAAVSKPAVIEKA